MAKQKIVIIEDDVAISQMYRLKFEAEGYDVAVAENGAIGFDVVQDFQPDVVLLDMMMPEMNGDETLAKIRAEDWGKDITVFILTNLGKEEAPKALASLNVKDYIVKAEMTPKQVAEKVKSSIG